MEKQGKADISPQTMRNPHIWDIQDFWCDSPESTTDEGNWAEMTLYRLMSEVSAQTTP
jgi:hypothetical protein